MAVLYDDGVRRGQVRKGTANKLFIIKKIKIK